LNSADMSFILIYYCTASETFSEIIGKCW